MAQVVERVQEILDPAEMIPRVIGRYSPLHIDHGKGIYVWDVNGERYTDFTSGIAVVNTGHCHPRVVAAIQDQAARIIHAQANILAHSPMMRAAKLLTETTAPNLNQVFWTNSRGRGDGGGDQAGQGRHRPARHHRLPARVPRPDARGDGGDVVSGQGARALRAADSQRLLRAVPVPVPEPLQGRAGRCRSLLLRRAGGALRPDGDAGRRGGHPDGDRRRRGRVSRPDQAVAADGAGAVRPARHHAHPGRGAVRHGPHRQDVGVRALRRRAGHHDRGQGAGLGYAGGGGRVGSRAHGQVGAGIARRAPTAATRSGRRRRRRRWKSCATRICRATPIGWAPS